MNDAPEVSRPPHYTQGEIEHLDALRTILTADEWRGFLRGQVFKYLWRMADKGKPLEDSRKAHFYLCRLIHHLKEVQGEE